MTKEEQQKDDIETMKILFNADINELCNQRRFNDAREMEGIRDRIIKALEQQPSEPRTNLAETSQDCISIEPIQWYSQNKDGYLVKGAYSKDEAYVKLTDVYEKIRISEDCISREEVQDLISRWLSDYLLDETREALETINYKVGDMPAVYPERPKGKWIGKYISGATDYEVLIKQWQIAKCNQCGKEYKTPYTDCKFVDYAYCPYCGSYNGGGEE